MSGNKKLHSAFVSNLYFIAVAVFITSADAREENYFPLDVGNWWLYQLETRQILDRGDEIDTSFIHLEVINEEVEEACDEPLAFPWEDGYLCFLPNRYDIVKKTYSDRLLSHLRSTDTITAYTNGLLVEIQAFGKVPDCTEDYVYGKYLFGDINSAIQIPHSEMRVNCGRDTSFRYEKDIDFPTGTGYTPTNTIYGYNDNPVDGDAVYLENQVGVVLHVKGWGMGRQVLLESNLLSSKTLKSIPEKTHSALKGHLKFSHPNGNYKINGQKYRQSPSSKVLNQVLIQK